MRTSITSTQPKNRFHQINGLPTEVSGEECMKTLIEMDLESMDLITSLWQLLTVIWGS